MSQQTKQVQVYTKDMGQTREKYCKNEDIELESSHSRWKILNESLNLYRRVQNMMKLCDLKLSKDVTRLHEWDQLTKNWFLFENEFFIQKWYVSSWILVGNKNLKIKVRLISK